MEASRSWKRDRKREERRYDSSSLGPSLSRKVEEEESRSSMSPFVVLGLGLLEMMLETGILNSNSLRSGRGK